MVIFDSQTGQTSTSLSWYINGLLAPEMWLRRGLTYAFKVYGGNNPHSAEYYHPLIVTDEPHGGYDRLSDIAQSKIRVLAGVEFTRRGRPKPLAGKKVDFIIILITTYKLSIKLSEFT